MMNRIIFTIATLLLLIWSCQKERDVCDEVIGTYSGIRVHTYWNGDTINPWQKDTSIYSANVGNLGSGLELSFMSPWHT
jgi:hypothetical protein